MSFFKPTARSLLNCFDPTLALLSKEIEQHRLIAQRIKSAVPVELASHVLYCLARPGKVIMYTDSSAWASQLRFHQEIILAALNQTQSVLQIKVSPAFTQGNRLTISKPNIPPQSIIRDIERVSKYINDKELSDALARLSGTLSRAREDI